MDDKSLIISAKKTYFRQPKRKANFRTPTSWTLVKLSFLQSTSQGKNHLKNIVYFFWKRIFVVNMLKPGRELNHFMRIRNTHLQDL